VSEIELGVKLAKYSTLGVGGKADFFTTVTKRDDLVAALNWAFSGGKPFFILGAGSNVLISDGGFRGLVIINRVAEYSVDGCAVNASSGMNLAKVARETLAVGLAGLHFGAGIPGTIGGAVVGNAGALGWDISRTLKTAEVWHHGKIEKWTNTDFEYGYRTSKLKAKRDYVVLAADFELENGNAEEMQKLIVEDAKRRAASYLGRTCGSYFKNPEGKSAGELIDGLGLKGYRIGGAEVSPLHANVFRNVGGATAADFIELEKYLITKVKKAYGITLEPEAVKTGF